MELILREQIKELSTKIDEKHEENLNRFNNIVDRLTRIEEGHKHLDECLDELKRKLFGNGQPGIIQNHEKRITSLETIAWLAKGGWKVLLSLVSFIVILIEVVIRLIK